MEGSLNITGSFLIKGNQIQGIRSDRVSEELRTEVRDIVEEAVIKIIPPKKEMQKGKMVVCVGLTNS